MPQQESAIGREIETRALSREPSQFEGWSEADLRIRAGELGIDGCSRMNRDQLIEMIRGQEAGARGTR